MGRTAKQPFRSHKAQVEVKVPVKKNGEWIDTWEFVKAVEGQFTFQSSSTGPPRYGKDEEVVTHKIRFRDDPGLTVNHRLIYQDRVLYYAGGYNCLEGSKMWVAFFKESFVEQPSRFMNMNGAGMKGLVLESHEMSGGANGTGEVTTA